MRIQTNTAAGAGNNEDKVLNADIDTEIQKFEQSLHEDKIKEHQDFNKWYGVTTYILLFLTFSIMGWVWEVVLHFVQTGEFVKRGVLIGPWLPIYGNGAILLLILFRKAFKNPIHTFFITMILSSIIEYYTSWYLEMKNGVRWWDYSGYFMNLNGRICLFGAVVFAIGGCLVVYIFAPKLGNLYNKINFNVKVIICAALVCLFLADQIYSFHHPNLGKGITGYRNIETCTNQG